MKISFFAYYRNAEYAGCKETTLTGPATLRDLGETLGTLYGTKLHDEFFSPDKSALGEKIIVMVNGRRAEFLDGLDTILSDTDQILIFPIVAGG